MDEINIQCPYCYQAISILLDLGAFDFTTIVEDCSVCCRPIEISYKVCDNEITSLSYSAIDGNEF